MSEHKDGAGLAGIILVFVAVTAVVFYGIGFYSGNQSGQLMAIEKYALKDQAIFDKSNAYWQHLPEFKE